MKRNLLVLTVLNFWQLCLYGQGADVFFSGYTSSNRSKIDFSTGVPVVSNDTSIKVEFDATIATITNMNNNLMFYTNGIVVCNTNNDTMPNGTGLNPCSFTTQYQYNGLPIPQSHLIIPMPDDSNKFYLIHESLDYPNLLASSQIYYSIIDMSLNGGLGDLTQKNTSFFQDTLVGGMLTACKHANGRDWWIIVAKKFYPTYYLFLITPNGIQYVTSQTIGQRYYQGQVAFSPDGTHYGYYDNIDDVEIFDFDRCNGSFSNPRFVSIIDSMWGYGFAFSPNSKLAYLGSGYYLYQLNLDSTNLGSSLTTIAVWDSTFNPFPQNTGFGVMELASDNKIYITTTGFTYEMHTIEAPDNNGLACNVNLHKINLFTYNSHTIPNHPNYFLGPVLGSVCDSLGLGIDDNIYTKNLNLRVNPNPATNMFYLNYQLPNGINADMILYNTLGEKVMHKKLYWYFGYLLIDASTLKNGIYFINVQTENKHTANAKLVIEK